MLLDFFPGNLPDYLKNELLRWLPLGEAELIIQAGIQFKFKPFWLSLTTAPFLNITLGKTVYLAENWRKSPEGEHEGLEFVSEIIHELAHVRQEMAVKNLFNDFYRPYLLNPAFRWAQEKEAYAAQIQFLENKGFEVDLESWAKLMADEYGKMVSHEEALAFIKGVLGK